LQAGSATVVNIKGKSYRMRHHQAQLEAERRVAHDLSESSALFVIGSLHFS
jgi:hypothetical protein